MSQGSLWPLAGLPKCTWGWANGINDNGKIVGSQGYVARGVLVDRAVLWTARSTAVDLNSKVSLAKGEVLVSASHINAGGDIIASTIRREMRGIRPGGISRTTSFLFPILATERIHGWSWRRTAASTWPTRMHNGVTAARTRTP